MRMLQTLEPHAGNRFDPPDTAIMCVTPAQGIEWMWVPMGGAKIQVLRSSRIVFTKAIREVAGLLKVGYGCCWVLMWLHIVGC